MGAGIVFPILLIVIWLICVAFLYTEGMWSNAIRLINVVTAALLAFNFWEPLARWLEGMYSAATYFYDFVTLWGLFCISYLLFSQATGFVSGVRVRFKAIADRIGGIVFAAWVGWVVVCFATATLHTAPLAEKFLFGGFDYQERMLFGTAPDRLWLSFVQRMSRGPFSRSLGEGEKAVFDPDRKFIDNYADRRATFEEQLAAGSGVGDLLVAEGGAPAR